MPHMIYFEANCQVDEITEAAFSEFFKSGTLQGCIFESSNGIMKFGIPFNLVADFYQFFRSISGDIDNIVEDCDDDGGMIDFARIEHHHDSTLCLLY